MDIRVLEVFCKIVELKSFSKAAEAVYLTQPTVSGQIKILEDEVGVRLLDRLGREVTPTKAGEILYRYAVQILSLRMDAVQAIEEFKGGLRGNLVIGASSIPGAYVLPTFLARFKEKYPEVSVRVRIGDSHGICKAVGEGTLELGVVGARFADPKLAYEKLTEDELVLVVPPSHPWAKRGAVAVEELAGEPFVIREQGSGSRKMMEEALEKAGLPPGSLRVALEMDNDEAIRQAVKAGAGIAIMSDRAIASDLTCKTLHRVPITGLKITRDFYLVSHKSRSPSPLCDAFLVFLRDSVSA